MSSLWRETTFGEFIKLRKEFITINDYQEYQRVTVQLHARGVKERDRILGSKIKTKEQQLLEAGDLLVAEIDAKVGGFGIVPPELEGAIVSSHYFTYEIDTTVANPDYVAYYLRSGKPTEEVQQYVKGSTNYAAIRNYHFPKLTIPLPSLEEQKKLVLILNAFTNRIYKARKLLSSNLQASEALIPTSIDAFFNGLPVTERHKMTIEKISTYVQRGRSPKYSNSGQVLVINQKCVQPEGLILSEARYLADDQVPKLQPYRYIQTGDVLLNSTGEGTIGRSVVVEQIDQKFVVDSHVTIIRANQDIVLPGWIDYFLKSTSGQDQINTNKTGSTKQTELSKTSVLDLELIVPHLETQAKILRKVDNLARRSYHFENLFFILLERYGQLETTLLERAFSGRLEVNIPGVVLIEMQSLRDKEQQRHQQILAARRAAQVTQEEQPPVEKIEINTAADLTRLLKQLTNNGQTQVSAGELWQLSALNDIDTFYAYLSQEYLAGHIRERREGYQVYLEPEDETETTVD